MLFNQSSPLIMWTQRSRCKVIIILVAFTLILILDVLYENGVKQTNSIAPSESFSLNLNPTTAASEAFSSNLDTIRATTEANKEYDVPLIVTTFYENYNFYENSRDVKDQPITMGRYGNDIPFFWSIPKAGTATINDILSECLNLRMAGSSSQIDYDSYDQIQVVNGGLGDANSRGGHFVNVNFGYLPGILKAQEWKMAESGLVDVAVTSYIHKGITKAFDHFHPARIFTVLRHPTQRMISLFRHHKDAMRDKDITLLEFASDSQHYVDNWMTRTLSNQHHGPVRGVDYLYAKIVMKERVLILLLDEINESVERLVAFMAWGSRLEPPLGNGDKAGGLGGNACIESYLHSNPANAHHNDQSKTEGNSTEWQMLKDINKYDLDLYSYGKELFDGEQKELYNNLRSKSG